MQNNTRLARIESQKVIGGVCAGLGQYFALDVTVVRLVFVLVTILGVGATIPLYLILWAVLPSEGTPQAYSNQQFKASLEEMKDQAQVAVNRVKDAFSSAPRQDWKFDPHTGQPINQPQPQADKPRFDPYTGQPLER